MSTSVGTKSGLDAGRPPLLAANELTVIQSADADTIACCPTCTCIHRFEDEFEFESTDDGPNKTEGTDLYSTCKREHILEKENISFGATCDTIFIQILDMVFRCFIDDVTTCVIGNPYSATCTVSSNIGKRTTTDHTHTYSKPSGNARIL